MRRAALALVAAAALVLVPSAAAQPPVTAAAELVGWLAGRPIITGGLRVSLAPLAVLEISIEQPIFVSPEGWRVGGVLSIRGSTNFTTDARGEALAGVTATFPAGPQLAIQAQVLWREVWAGGAGPHGAPELSIVFAAGL